MNAKKTVEFTEGSLDALLGGFEFQPEINNSNGYEPGYFMYYGDASPIEAKAELAALIVERDELRHAIRSAQIQLRATQENWREDCLFNCNDILTAALKGESK